MFLVESDGYKWVVRPGTDDHLGPGHENWLNSVMWIPSGGVFVDVGAHVGHFTVRLANNASRVIAFEPGLVQYRGLRKNLDLNKITNVESFYCALSNRSYAIKTKSPGGNGQMQIEETENVEGAETIAYPLDFILGPGKFQIKPLERLDLIKIDVQGHEANVLAGMHKTVEKFKPRLVIELHDKEFHDPSIWEGVQAELTKMNYKWTKIGEFGTNWWIQAVPNEAI